MYWACRCKLVDLQADVYTFLVGVFKSKVVNNKTEDGVQTSSEGYRMVSKGARTAINSLLANSPGKAIHAFPDLHIHTAGGVRLYCSTMAGASIRKGMCMYSY
jgi:hypothetical protein